ncbi:MAG: membrane dipeptidase [Alphaproteobacteria bacterium]|nr:membrane dipeptidase [Alphaproteobacteria bacterium]
MTDWKELHDHMIVIDATCPLLHDKAMTAWYREGGATAVAPTVGGFRGGAAHTVKALGGWLKHIRETPGLRHVTAASDIEDAKAAGELGLIFHFQGTDPIEESHDAIDAYAALGVGMIQLCYNAKNRIGDGAGERTDAGLSDFGIAAIERMNANRVVVDCAHTGYRTTMEAVEASSAPVVVSHANAKAVCDNRRNVPDDLIEAVAKSGGLVGTVGFPAFLGPETRPTLDRFIDDIAYKAKLVGIEHVGLGIDYFPGQHPVADEAAAMARYEMRLSDASGWRAEDYPPPPYHFPEGIETPRTLGNLTRGLLERGFAEDEVRQVMGLNWLRVFREVWGG